MGPGLQVHDAEAVMPNSRINKADKKSERAVDENKAGRRLHQCDGVHTVEP